MEDRERRRSVIGSLVVIGLLLGACGRESPTESTGAAPAGSSIPTGEGLSEAEIISRAVEAATSLGDPEPTDIEWTYSTQAAAARVASGDDLSPSPYADTPAIVIQAQGSFTVLGEPSPPPDAAGNTVPPPTGRAFMVIIDAVTGQPYGASVKHEPIDLAELGPVSRPSQPG